MRTQLRAFIVMKRGIVASSRTGTVRLSEEQYRRVCTDLGHPPTDNPDDRVIEVIFQDSFSAEIAHERRVVKSKGGNVQIALGRDS